MVPLEEFCGSSAESRMQDLNWLGPLVCRHEAVIEHVMRHSPVFPARFGTLFSSIESLEDFLKKHYGEISRFLDKVTGKEEWAVKGLLNRARAREEFLSVILARQEKKLSSSPGMRYFQEQQIRAGVDKALNCWLKSVCQEIANDLRGYASDFCKRKVLDRGAEGNETVLNWAFLVTRSAIVEFRERIDRVNANLAHQGLVFELSGPWPPYSFSSSLNDK